MPCSRVNTGSASCCSRVDPRRAEVVAQAERVADLVHRHVLEVGAHEGLGLRAAGLELAARLEHVGAVAICSAASLAVGRSTRPESRRATSSGVGSASRNGSVDAARRQDLGARRPDVARRQALDADVGVEDLAAARIDVARPDRAEGRRRVGHPADRGATEVEGVEVGRRRAATSTRIASLKPIFSNALFHSSMPAVIGARYLTGMVRSIQ